MTDDHDTVTPPTSDGDVALIASMALVSVVALHVAAHVGAVWDAAGVPGVWRVWCAKMSVVLVAFAVVPAVWIRSTDRPGAIVAFGALVQSVAAAATVVTARRALPAGLHPDLWPWPF